ncbi:MAG: CBS domain-containing protein [Verrucomicrobia bacterium]|nr:CBS domain-containing protein [Verrucomicrobiota bacterium]
MMTAEDILIRKGAALHSVFPTATIREALSVMTSIGIGSILIMDKGSLVGIWTERDLTKHSLGDGFSIETTRMESCMVRNLDYTPHTHTILQLMDKIVGRRQRRLLIQKEGKFIGLLKPGDVMRSCLLEKTKEIEGLNALVGWEYYEDWRWAPGMQR